MFKTYREAGQPPARGMIMIKELCARCNVQLFLFFCACSARALPYAVPRVCMSCVCKCVRNAVCYAVCKHFVRNELVRTRVCINNLFIFY